MQSKPMETNKNICVLTQHNEILIYMNKSIIWSYLWLHCLLVLLLSTSRTPEKFTFCFGKNFTISMRRNAFAGGSPNWPGGWGRGVKAPWSRHASRNFGCSRCGPRVASGLAARSRWWPRNTKVRRSIRRWSEAWDVKELKWSTVILLRA